MPLQERRRVYGIARRNAAGPHSWLPAGVAASGGAASLVRLSGIRHDTRVQVCVAASAAAGSGVTRTGGAILGSRRVEAVMRANSSECASRVRVDGRCESRLLQGEICFVSVLCLFVSNGLANLHISIDLLSHNLCPRIQAIRNKNRYEDKSRLIGGKSVLSLLSQSRC